MPTPIEKRPTPGHVEIPDLPAGMSAWADFVTHLDPTYTVRRGGWDIIVEHVVDGRTAARALRGIRYSGRSDEWTDEAQGRRGDWHREWIVIALSEGDPYFVDISREELPVYKAPHGAGSWKARKVKPTLAEFISSMTVKPPVEYPPYEFPQPYPKDSSVSVLDWGPRKEELHARLIAWQPGFFQPHSLARRAQTPTVLIRNATRPFAEALITTLEHFGASGEIGPAMPRPPRPPKEPAEKPEGAVE